MTLVTPLYSMLGPCAHTDDREFDDFRSCLACSETRFHEDPPIDEIEV
jgi:hypothetical protein